LLLESAEKTPAGIYTRCSATTMARKKNSDGRIVIEEPKVIEIYNAISPKDAKKRCRKDLRLEK